MMSKVHVLLILGILLLLPSRVEAQGTDGVSPKSEFRGAWIATVLNLDWPRTTATEAQQQELIDILDGLKASGINAVFFQVRSEADAMYESSIEPWSYWLTGAQGEAPDPLYDPLAFAIEEAHKRGMELHAWFNPFRADRGSGYTKADNHITNAHPEWVLQVGGIEIINPGIPDARQYVVDVITDVVTRYDIDGVHFDDYFYPYPPDQISNQDRDTFDEYGGDFTSIGAWRRDNINTFVSDVQVAIEAVRPDIKYGISPFGIWKNGTPSGIVGLDAYRVIYADAVTWMDQEWIDYLVPQLYWPFGGGQDYGKLAPWWESVRNGRHLYIGHGLYRSDPNTAGGGTFAADEIPRQVRFNRMTEGIDGSVFFRALNLTRYSSKGFADTLQTDLFRLPAITPPLPWNDQTAPGVPENVDWEYTGDEDVTLTWDAPSPADGQAEPRFYAVYRVRVASEPDFNEVLQDAQHLLAVTGETMLVDQPGIASEAYYYAVTALSDNSIESAPSDAVVTFGRATDIEQSDALADFELRPSYPNPFTVETEIPFVLRTADRVTLRVFDVLGREVALLVADSPYGSGTHAVTWNGTTQEGKRVASGTYFMVLEVGNRRVTQPVAVVR